MSVRLSSRLAGIFIILIYGLLSGLILLVGYLLFDSINFRFIHYGKIIGTVGAKFVTFGLIWLAYGMAREGVLHIKGAVNVWWQMKAYGICIGAVLILALLFADKLGNHSENCETDTFGTQCETVVDYNPSESAKVNYGAETFLFFLIPVLAGCYKGINNKKNDKPQPTEPS